MRTFIGNIFLIAGFGLLLALGTRCSSEDPEIYDLELLCDPQIASLDGSSPFTYFNGSFGSIRLGEGWGIPEPVPGKAGLDWQVRVTGTEADLFFDKPPFPEIDFVAAAHPAPAWELPWQEITFHAAHRQVGAVTLANQGGVFRVPLDLKPSDSNPVRLTLRFHYAAISEEPALGAEPRQPAAAFRRLAVVPRQMGEVFSYINAMSVDGVQKKVRLPAGASFSIPLPPSKNLRLNLGAVSSQGNGDRFAIRLLLPDEQKQELWEGRAAKASYLTQTFVTPDRLSRLQLHFHGRGRPDLNACMEIELPENFLSIREDQQQAPDAPAANVFIYLIDSLRADSLSVHHYPRIEAFAGDAVTYLNARSVSSWTLPATVSMLTGVYPYRHRVRKGDIKLTSKNVPSLARILASRGYNTAAFSHSAVASADFGLDTGFDTFISNNHLQSPGLRSQEMRRHFLHWLQGRDSLQPPTFAYFHSVDPHAPYTPAAPFRPEVGEPTDRFAPEWSQPVVFRKQGLHEDPEARARFRALYEGEVAYADAEFGRFLALLKYLGLYDNSLIVLASGHGEEFFEHGGGGHGRTLYEEVLRVPLLIKFPGSRWAGEKVSEPVSLVDVVPTVLACLGMDATSLNLDGQALIVREEEEWELCKELKRLIFAELQMPACPDFGPVTFCSVVLENLKCIYSETGVNRFREEIPHWRFFDLARDGGEQSPLAEEDPRAHQAKEAIKRWISDVGKATRVPTEKYEQTDAAARERLKKLGYGE